MGKAHTATIAFGGLVDEAEVKQAQQDIIDSWEHKVASYNKQNPNKAVTLVIGEKLVAAGGKFQHLPPLPKTGKLIIKSKEYVVADVHCAYVDILPQTYSESALHWGFQTKAGSTIIIQK